VGEGAVHSESMLHHESIDRCARLSAFTKPLLSHESIEQVLVNRMFVHLSTEKAVGASDKGQL
jgi:hypothetical protein